MSTPHQLHQILIQRLLKPIPSPSAAQISRPPTSKPPPNVTEGIYLYFSSTVLLGGLLRGNCSCTPPWPGGWGMAPPDKCCMPNAKSFIWFLKPALHFPMRCQIGKNTIPKPYQYCYNVSHKYNIHREDTFSWSSK